MSKVNHKKLKFTYGHQFEPEKFSLIEITQLCKNCQPDRKKLEQQILFRYFSKHSQENTSRSDSSSNQRKLAMNCFLSLRAYKIIEDIQGEKQYKLGDFGEEILQCSHNSQEINKSFARHILVNLTGMSLLKAIEAINTRGETPNLELIAYELQEMGFSISPNAIYTSTMRKWLKIAKIFNKEYDINWVDVDVLAKEIGITFVTGADVVMVVTTGKFTRDAFQYASRMMEISRYYMILLQQEDIEAIKENKTNITKILDKQARRLFAKKELAMQDKEIDQVESEEEMLSMFNLYEEE